MTHLAKHPKTYYFLLLILIAGACNPRFGAHFQQTEKPSFSQREEHKITEEIPKTNPELKSKTPPRSQKETFTTNPQSLEANKEIKILPREQQPQDLYSRSESGNVQAQKLDKKEKRKTKKALRQDLRKIKKEVRKIKKESRNDGISGLVDDDVEFILLLLLSIILPPLAVAFIQGGIDFHFALSIALVVLAIFLWGPFASLFWAAAAIHAIWLLLSSRGSI